VWSSGLDSQGKAHTQRKIEATDRQIDARYCELCGLTEEKIGIVEVGRVHKSYDTAEFRGHMAQLTQESASYFSQSSGRARARQWWQFCIWKLMAAAGRESVIINWADGFASIGGRFD
jgi:hypothetical protein